MTEMAGSYHGKTMDFTIESGIRLVGARASGANTISHFVSDIVHFGSLSLLLTLSFHCREIGQGTVGS